MKIIRFVVYCGNFYAYYYVFGGNQAGNIINSDTFYIVVLNAAINYLVLTQVLPAIFLKRLEFHS